MHKMRIITIIVLIIALMHYSRCQTTDGEEDVTFRNHSIDSRIVGGKLAKLGQFPYQASLRTDNRPMCGATIISSKYAFTAAHCVVDKNNVKTSPNRLSLRAGSLKLDSGGIIINVAEVKVHPKYKFPVNDYALLRFLREIKFTKTIRPLPVASKHVSPGTQVLVSGFGATQTGGTMSNELRYLYQRAQSDEDCYRRAPKDPSIFCLSHPQGRGICQGDSGGPAVANGCVIGAMSFTLGACGTAEPDGFARAANAYQWLMQNIR